MESHFKIVYYYYIRYKYYAHPDKMKLALPYSKILAFTKSYILMKIKQQSNTFNKYNEYQYLFDAN